MSERHVVQGSSQSCLAWMSAHNLNVRQRSLESSDAHVGHSRVAQDYRRELGQPTKVPQSSVCHLGAPEVEHLEARQPLEVDESGLCDPRAAQFQALQLAKPFEMHQPGVRNSGVVERQRLEASQPLDLYQAGVRHRAILRGHTHKEMSEVGQLFDMTHDLVGVVASLDVHGFCEQVVSEQSAEPAGPGGGGSSESPNGIEGPLICS